MSRMQSYFEVFHGFPPTEDQQKFLQAFDRFIASKKERCCLLLNGYAGTGKTTVLAACSNYLREKKVNTTLMAPTGRAAKIMQKYAEKPAFTIHRMIYTLKKSRAGGYYFALKNNPFKNAVFIVDEASMIGESGGGLLSNSLLDDLVKFVFSGPGCRLILVGDEAQLPPVGSDYSPALQEEKLALDYQLLTAKFTLSEVLRQAQDSGILGEATKLRELLTLGKVIIPKIKLHRDVVYVSKYDFADHYQSQVNKHGEDNVLYITRSNKQANQLNQEIRIHVNQSESILDGGDKLMVVKNNYYWMGDDSNQAFIANGDFCDVQHVRNVHEAYGYQFADVSLYFSDYDTEVDARVWLDALTIPQASMPYSAAEKIWHLIDEELMTDYPAKPDRNIQLKKNPYIQALQVKFGHVITCHKSQGGQWPVVYLDLGYFTEEMLDINLLRWLYTAFTRASEKLYLVNFPADWLLDD